MGGLCQLVVLSGERSRAVESELRTEQPGKNVLLRVGDSLVDGRRLRLGDTRDIGEKVGDTEVVAGVGELLLNVVVLQRGMTG